MVRQQLKGEFFTIKASRTLILKRERERERERKKTDFLGSFGQILSLLSL